jgi:hypothetical protein
MRTAGIPLPAMQSEVESRRSLARILIVFMIVQETGDPRFQLGSIV